MTSLSTFDTLTSIQLRTLTHQSDGQYADLSSQGSLNKDISDSTDKYSSTESLICLTSSSEDSDISSTWSDLASIIRGARNTHNQIPASNPRLCCFRRYDNATIETLHNLQSLYGPLAFHLACFKSSLKLNQIAKYPLSHSGESFLHALCQEALKEVGFQTLVYIQAEMAALVSEIRFSDCIRPPKSHRLDPLPKTCKVLLSYIEISREGAFFFSNSEVRAIMEYAARVRADTSLHQAYGLSENRACCPNLFALAYSIASLHPSVIILNTNNHPNRENFILPCITQSVLLEDCWRYHLLE